MLQIVATSSLPSQGIVLPSPQMDDEIFAVQSVTVLEMMNGRVKTHAHTSDQYLVTYKVMLSREKRDELEKFFLKFAGEEMIVYAQRETLVGKLLGSTLDTTTIGIDDRSEVQLQFVGKRR